MHSSLQYAMLLTLLPSPTQSLRRTGRGRAHGSDAFVWTAGKDGGKANASAGDSSSRGKNVKGAGGVLSFWPLPLELAGGETVLLELRGDPAGVVSDLRIGTAQLSLAALVQQHPQLLAGEAVALHVALQPGAAFGASPSTAAAVAAAAGEAADGSREGERDSDGEEEEEQEGQQGEQGERRGRRAASGAADTAGGAAAGTSVGAPGAAAGGATAAPRLPSLPAAASPGLPAQASLDPCASSASSTQPPQQTAAPGGAVGRALASAALAVSGAAVKAVNMVAIPAAALFKSEAAAELDAAASAASEFAAAAGGHPTLSLTVQLEPVSCLEAAIAAGLTPAAAQTCLAMLAEPGGLVSGSVD